jgi:hypothetical protein
MWQVDLAARSTTLTIEVEQEAWVGFALPTSPGQMAGAYAILCMPDTHEVTEATLNRPFPSGFVYPATSGLRNASMMQFAAPSGRISTACTFTRPWVATNGEPDFSPNGGNFLIAVGKSNTFDSGHVLTAGAPGYPVVLSFDFMNGAAVTTAGGSLTKFQKSAYAHGVLMTLAWAWLIPFGILIAHFKVSDRLGVRVFPFSGHVHRFCRLSLPDFLLTHSWRWCAL